jgi:cold shock CspA family protein/ribosome-associated translation inhibitor RaiA
MQTPVEIDIQGIATTPHVRTTIAKHVADLEQRFGRVTACRVVLKAPGGHHRTSGLYEINIRLALPDGREVNVDRTAQADERHSDLDFAINDAFKRARRQLQDQVRELQGQVKHHEGAPIGTVVQLDPLGEFGLLESSDGQEIYFHRNSVLDDDYSQLAVGSRVTYAEEMGDKGPQASTVKLMGKHSLRV